MKRQMNFLASTAAAAVLLTLAACQRQTRSVGKPAAEESARAVTLPISVNAVMAGLVDPASDLLFSVGNGNLPKTDHDWAIVRNHAYQVIIAGKAIQLGATGPKDAEWRASPQWKTYADQLSDIGLDALKLAEAKQTKGWDTLGNKLVDTCLACHAAFKLDIPTEGIRREALDESVFH